MAPIELTIPKEFFHKDLIAYGTGYVGKRIIPQLLQFPELRILGVTNSRIIDEDAGLFLDTGLPLRSLHTWIRLYPQVSVLVTVADYQLQKEIVQNCREAGIQEILLVTPELAAESETVRIKSYITQKSIAFGSDQEFISVKNLKLLNPSRIENINAVSFWMELGEFILSEYYDDWQVPDSKEGPYTSGMDGELKSGDIVLDCGANLGLFSAYAASKGCLCYAFEPTPELIGVIEKNGDLNGGGVMPIEAAVSEISGMANFYICDENLEASSLLEDYAKKSCKIEQEPRMLSVKQITIDDFVKERHLTHVDFIKADIEGAERLMLLGAQETLREFSPRLSLCTYHLPDDKEVLTDLILKANPNYKISYKWKKLYAYIPGL